VSEENEQTNKGFGYVTVDDLNSPRKALET